MFPCKLAQEEPPAEVVDYWELEKLVVVILLACFCFIAIIFLITWIALRRGPRDFDDIMVDDVDHNEDFGYTSPGFNLRR